MGHDDHDHDHAPASAQAETAALTLQPARAHADHDHESHLHVSAPLLLGLSALVLVLGPVLLGLASRAAGLLAAVDAFVLVSVGGIVLLDVLPDALHHGGWPAIALLVLGFGGPQLLERLLHRAARAVHLAALGLALVGLVVHATMDGVVLGATAADGHDMPAQLALAVLLHRLPEGLTIWWLLRPSWGGKAAAAVLTLVGLATAAGMRLAEHNPHLHEAEPLALFQVFVAGSLLHVILHRPHPLLAQTHTRGWQWPAGLGGLTGIAVVGLILSGHDHTHDHLSAQAGESLWQVFGQLASESAPALLIAYLLAGLVPVLMPAASVAWLQRGGPFGQALRGVAFGLPLPICSCGVVPLYTSLARRGVPPAAGLAFLVATPELGLDAVLLSLPLLGLPLAMARVVAAALVALLVGWLLGRLPYFAQALQRPLQVDAPTAPEGTLGQRLWQGLRYGLGEMVDHTAPWILAGLALATLATPLLGAGQLTALPAGLDVPLLALAGMPMYVCASGATPLVAVLIAAGVSPGAALAFLLTGPATNLTTFGVLARLHNRRLALGFGVLMAVLSMLAGWLTNLALGGYQLPVHSEHDGHAHALASDLLLGALGVLLAASLLRQGPRAFVSQVLAVAGGHAHSHDHDHDHGHAHSHAHDHGHGHDHSHTHAHSAAATGLPVYLAEAGDGCAACGHHHPLQHVHDPVSGCEVTVQEDCGTCLPERPPQPRPLPIRLGPKPRAVVRLARSPEP